MLARLSLSGLSVIGRDAIMSNDSLLPFFRTYCLILLCVKAWIDECGAFGIKMIYIL